MKNIYLALIIAIIGGITLTGGDCDDSTGTGGGTQNDPNVLVFENLVVAELDPTNGQFGGQSPSALNLLIGRVDSANSNDKDISLVDENSTSQNFYFRSGSLSDNLPIGYLTKFGQLIEATSMTQAQFDTLSRIWNSPLNSDTLLAGDFPNENTRYPGANEFFNHPLQNNTVYAFYLQGKDQAGVTSNPVFGLLRLEGTQEVGGLYDFRVSVDVKINVAGINQFRQQVPVQ